MLAIIILGLSITLQFVAASVALYHIRVTKRWWSWGLLAAAMTLMGVRRTVTLSNFVFTDDPLPVDITTELIALVISVLMVFGVLFIGPVFKRIQRVQSVLRASEERAKGAEQLLIDAIASISEGFVLFDTDGRLVLCNSKYKELYQYSDTDAVIGVHMNDLGRLDVERNIVVLPSDKIADYVTRRDSPQDGLPQNYQIQLTDGRHLHIRDRLTATGGIVSVQTDITEQKKAQATLQESEVQFRHAEKIAKLYHWIAVYDGAEWTWTYASQNAEALLQTPIKGLIGSHQSFLQYVHPDDRDLLQKTYSDTKADYKRYELNYRIIRGDGDIRHFYEVGEPAFDETGVFSMFRGTTQDVTEQKILELQLRQSQKMESVGQLTGGVAHDFNNLMAIMIGNAGLLKDYIGDDEEANNCVDAIIEAVERGSSLTDRLLAFSRQQILSPVATDVSHLINSLSDMLRRTLGKTVDLTVKETDGLWLATIDPHQFENALVNLAINARDAMPNGGKLVIETANVTLDQTNTEQQEDVTPGNYVMVAVSDTGTGMSPEILEKVFEPFFTTKEVGKGSGLGLSMVYGFAKQSNGHTSIYSEVDQGTTVKLYMPRSTEDKAETTVKPRAVDLGRGSERILVVEDDPEVRKIPVTILRKQGYEIVEVGDGKTAIERLRGDQQFDLLFTDIILPGGINGMEIATMAKNLHPHIKVLFTTGYTEHAVTQNGKLESGIMQINKPYSHEDLLNKIRLALDDVS